MFQIKIKIKEVINHLVYGLAVIKSNVITNVVDTSI